MFSQSQEEKYILDYFGDFIGTFADIGCNDCETLSNTRALALKGWKGILLDCSPKAIDRCKKLYKGHKGIYIYDYAVGSAIPGDTIPRNGKLILQESGNLIGADDVGLVSTFHKHERERFQKIVQYEPVEVDIFTWKTALNRWKYKHFEMISLDVEGCEMDILPHMDLTNTQLLCIEHNGSKEKENQYLECTSKFGLSKIIYESAENLIIVR